MNEAKLSNDISKIIKITLISTIIGYIITCAMLLIFALIMYKTNISINTIRIGITISYIISTLISGFIAGKAMKNRRFLWGILSGIIYFIILVLLSFIIGNKQIDNMTNVITAFILCTLSGMLGAIFS